METYATWVRLFELPRHYSWIVDRFHLSTMAWQRIHRGIEVDFAWLEERIEPLGFHVALLTRRDGDVRRRARAERFTVSGKPEQYDDLDVFVREQALLRELVEQSALPSREIDVERRRPGAGLRRRSAAKMTETGRLWAARSPA